MSQQSFLEVQFPIGPLSLESYIERLPYVGKPLNSLGKWWGSKPLVLVRAIILGAVFPASDDPDRWPDDLDIFLKCMCLDNNGMWRRKTESLSANLCYHVATDEEREALFVDNETWKRRGLDRNLKSALEKRAFYTLGHTAQREFCCRVEEIGGPSPESWTEINAYLKTTASSLPELVQQLSIRRFGKRLKVGDAFSGVGSIPFEAAELGCDVYASDLNPVAGLLTWGALNIIGGTDEFREKIHAEQKRIYDEVDAWILNLGIETSEEGWRAEAYLYCVEMQAPEWDGWRIPICPSWVIAPKTKTWVELVPIEGEKRFHFRVHNGGNGYTHAEKGTKQGDDLVCPPSLWEIFRRQGRHQHTPRTLSYNQLIENAGGLRRWEKHDFMPRPEDILQERLYCIRWRKPEWMDGRGRIHRGELVYREPKTFDLDVEARVIEKLEDVFDKWQKAGWIPNWRIEPGAETTRLTREKGWTHWHHLFTPRQLLIMGEYSRRITDCEPEIRSALCIPLGRGLNNNSKLCLWKPTDGGGIGGGINTFYNQAFNTVFNTTNRGWLYMKNHIMSEHRAFPGVGGKICTVNDSRHVDSTCHLWITDPPYADAVNYEELSEFFLAWYVPHLKAAFPDWYIDSMRNRAVKGNDAPFRMAMAECYRRLAENMPDNGMQVLMFTHKSTDVWEDIALIMWAAGLQVKQVWSVATETPGAGIRTGNYVQSTYNMVLRKRTGDKVGFVDFITPQVNKRVIEVITHMRKSQIEGGLSRCGYTDTDYLLAAQAAAAEVVTGYSKIDGVDLEAELHTPNAQRGRSALRILMENAKRAATDFLVPPVMVRAIKKIGAMDVYQFWREFSAEEKFILKGLELESQGMFKIGAFQDLGRAYGLSSYEELLGPIRANNTRTRLPEELPRPDSLRFDEVPPTDRRLWRHSPLRHIYHALKLVAEGADMDRAVKHLVNCTDFWNLRSTRLPVILAYLTDITASIGHWSGYYNHLSALSISVENWKA
jgi:adenine-specific DNA methylase